MKPIFRGARIGIVLIGLVGLLILSLDEGRADPVRPTNAPVVELKSVKYRELIEAVKSQRGKVVAVDVWATWCPPCMQHFPHLVGLHRKYKDQGLVCMSVSLDLMLYPQDGKQRSEKFLTEKQATFPNFLLEGADAVLDEKWRTGGPPLWFVFDRQGRRAGKFTSDDAANPLDYEEIDQLVLKLLQAKP